MSNFQSIFISFSVLFSITGFAQDTVAVIKTELKGVLLDAETNDPLPYANIVVQRINRGSITNESGQFSLDTTGLLETDSVSFLYIGYKTTNVAIDDIFKTGKVFLEEDIQNLNKVFVFGTPPNAKDIVKNVIENREKNYVRSTNRNQTFFRSRYISDIDSYRLKYKKSSISVLDEKMVKELEEKTPKHSTSYTDFLGNIYYSKAKVDSTHYKLDPIKTVALKEKDVADLDQINEVFEEVFANTQNEEYWKLKTGIFSVKMDVNMEDDSSSTGEKRPKDSRKVENSLSELTSALRYSQLTSESDWDFLYSTGKYNYTLVGGTNVGKEDVYIIDFTPKGGGLYIGRMYVSVESYALIRADYEYADGKTGTDVQLLGIGYHENLFMGSILFEKADSTYCLKYCAKQKGQRVNIDRSFAVVKKKERFLWDKTMKEVKIGLEMEMTSNESFEIMVLDQKSISQMAFKQFKAKKYHPILYVDQFDENLWKGYSIIEPTKKMREYKKREQ